MPRVSFADLSAAAFSGKPPLVARVASSIIFEAEGLAYVEVRLSESTLSDLLQSLVDAFMVHLSECDLGEIFTAVRSPRLRDRALLFLTLRQTLPRGHNPRRYRDATLSVVRDLSEGDLESLVAECCKL